MDGQRKTVIWSLTWRALAEAAMRREGREGVSLAEAARAGVEVRRRV